MRARAPAAVFSPPRATRTAPKAWALRARAPAFCSPPVNLRALSLGGGGCRRRRALRAARDARRNACFELLPRARVGWHTARTSVPPPPPCSSGAPVRWLMARGRRASGVAAAPRSHAAGAPAARRRRAVGGACACRARSNGRRRPLVGRWWWCAPYEWPCSKGGAVASSSTRSSVCPWLLLMVIAHALMSGNCFRMMSGNCFLQDVDEHAVTRAVPRTRTACSSCLHRTRTACSSTLMSTLYACGVSMMSTLCACGAPHA